jgi:hypothetical protein
MRSQLAFGALALLIGFSVAAAPRLLDESDDARVTDAARGNPRAIPTAPAQTRTAPAVVAQIPPASAVEGPSAPAPSPAAAVQAFLQAETDGDFAASYGLLALGDRTTQGSRAGWTAAHAQLPVVRGFAIGDVRATSERAEVDAQVVLRPELGPVVGLVPQTAMATWIALGEDGGWRVAFAESTLLPQYPQADIAPAAARTWIESRHGCSPRARAGLFTSSSRLADELCDARGPVHVGAPVPLEPDEASDPLLAAYGPDVFSWARVVPVTSPSRVGAVLAPLGPRWRVIGLVDLPFVQPTPQEGAQL